MSTCENNSEFDNNATIAFGTDHIKEALAKDVVSVHEDQINTQEEEMEERSNIRIMLERFGLKDSEGFIFKDKNNCQHDVIVQGSGQIKKGKDVFVTLNVKDRNSNEEYDIALGIINDPTILGLVIEQNRKLKLAIKKKDIVSVIKDTKEKIEQQCAVEPEVIKNSIEAQLKSFAEYLISIGKDWLIHSASGTTRVVEKVTIKNKKGEEEEIENLNSQLVALAGEKSCDPLSQFRPEVSFSEEIEDMMKIVTFYFKRRAIDSEDHDDKRTMNLIKDSIMLPYEKKEKFKKIIITHIETPEGISFPNPVLELNK